MTLPHFDEPKSENERLLNLQYEYKLLNREKDD